ncbi:AsmA family protein [uncultured Tateyamaria sp.]|uniref:AsmA family protein n=1 Tax=uncultured Tateyamaria sp. TaxID=455651 RepID=UPI0026229AC4|nr:AsmA family protein [uncultured Tateyamaria sp.]
MRWIVRLIGFVIVLVLVAGVSVLFLPAERIAKLATDQIRKATGRDVSITGDVSITVWPVLGVKAGQLEVANPDWSDLGPMLRAEDVAIGVDAMALISGDILITNIEATRPTIRLESRADGRASWVFTTASETTQIDAEAPVQPDETTAPTDVTQSSAPQTVSIQRLELTDATLIYDAEGADLVSYAGVDLTLDWPERLGAAEIAMTLRPAGSEVDVRASVGGFADFIDGQVQPIEMTVNAGGGTATLRGRASTAGDVAGQLALAMPDTDAFLAALDLPQPGLPAKLGQSIDMSTEMTLTSDRRLALRDLRVDLGGNALNGAADINLNDTPQINAQLNAGALDLRGATGGSTASSSGGGGGSSSSSSSGNAEPASGWPKDRIDASGLAAFNGEIALSASSIDLGQFKLGPTQTLLRNDRSRMVFDLRDVVAYGGNVTGQFVMNNRSGLSVGGQLGATSIDIQSFLRDAAEVERLTGTANASVSFLGVGQSVDAIVKSLSGDGQVKFGKGTILGIDLDRLMRSGQAGGGTTVFDSLTATWTMNAGVMENRDLLLKLKNYEARGEGQVGLGAQTIDYTFTPVALRANEGNGIAIPVRIRGPWASPSIRPDLDAAIDLNLDKKIEEEKAKVQAKAKAAVREKVAEELGVADEGQDLEEAAKDKLENELKKSLRGLFD